MKKNEGKTLLRVWVLCYLCSGSCGLANKYQVLLHIRQLLTARLQHAGQRLNHFTFCTILTLRVTISDLSMCINTRDQL